MDKVLELIQSIQAAFEEFKKANDERLKQLESRGFADPILSEKVDRINAHIQELVSQKQAAEDQEKRLVAVETTLARTRLSPDGQAQDPAKAAHRKAFLNFVRRGTAGDLSNLEIQAALSTQSDPDGGYMVPEEMDMAIARVAATASPMRELAYVQPIGTLTWKELVTTTGAAGGWVGEQETRAETTAPVLAQIQIEAKEVYAMPATTQVLLDDAGVDVEAWLAEEIGVTIGEKEGDGFINGAVPTRPNGILSYTAVANASYAWGSIGYIASGAASTIDDTDTLIDVQHALKRVYRTDAAWLMNDLTQAAIRKLKDGDGHYIWRPGLEPMAPDTLLGKPVAIDDNMPDLGTNAYPVAFASWRRAYKIVDRIGTRILRDPYSSKGNILFYATRRVGGGIRNFEAIKLVKCATS